MPFVRSIYSSRTSLSRHRPRAILARVLFQADIKIVDGPRWSELARCVDGGRLEFDFDRLLSACLPVSRTSAPDSISRLRHG
jgi:hypothetical protein